MSEPAEYKVKDVKVWTTEEGEEVKDFHGNFKLSITLEGVGEPADMTAKKLPEVGGTEYGHFEEYKTKAGRVRTKFMRDKRDDFSASSKPGKKSDAFLRDVTSVPIDMIRALLPYYDVQSLNSNAAQYSELMELAQKLTEDALTMVESIRNADKAQEKEDESKEG